MRKRGTAIIIEDGKVLLIYRRNPRGTYYVFPGGGVKAGETPEEGVIRECQEELGISVSVGPLFLEYVEEDVSLHIYAYKCVRTVKSGNVTWKERHKQTADNRYRVEWVEISRLAEITVLPEKLQKLLLAEN